MRVHVLLRLLAAFFVMSVSVKSLAADADDSKRVLVLDPGALHGYMQILLLEEIELQLKKPIAQIFHFIGGTSTGAVIASLLTHGSHGVPSFTAAEVRQFYEVHGSEIFKNRNLAISPFLSTRDVGTITNQFTMKAVKALPDVYRSNQTLVDLGQKFQRAFLERGISAIKEELLNLTTDKDLGLPSEVDLEDFTEFWAYELQAIHAFLHEANYYFDADLFKARLTEKLGEKTTIGQVMTPIALFATSYPLNRAEFLVQLLGNDFGSKIKNHDSKPEAMAFFSADKRAHKIKLVDAVYASSAASTLFPPAELVFDGCLKTFIDGAQNDHSTEEETIKLARKLWPFNIIEVFVLGYTSDEIRDLSRIKITDDGIVYDLRVPKSGHRDPDYQGCSKDNFALMRELAQKFIQSDYFRAVIDDIKASLPSS